MRLLFTFVGGQGHFDPLVPIARAAEAAGHVVAFGCAPTMLALVEEADFTGFALGTRAGSAPSRLPLRAVDREREDRDLRERFVRRAARYRAPKVIALCNQWRPDVVVCDETDFGALVASERLGLPFATVLVIASGSFVRREVIGEALDEVRAEHGLPADPDIEMLSRYLVLSPFPASYRDPAAPLPATAHAFHGAKARPAAGPTPAWASVLPGAPVVYFTLGSVFNLESGDLLSRVVDGLRDLPINLIVTVGCEIDPADLGAQPSNVHIAQHLPQSSVLRHCDLVVSHGGSGSVMGALAHGLPLVLIPIGADQPLNADRCSELGLAKVLDAMEVTPERIRAAASSVLADPDYRRNAERVRDEIDALPEPDHAVRLLERLAKDKQPLKP